MYTYTQVYIHTGIHIHRYTYTQVYIHTGIHTHRYTYTQVYIYTCIHTHSYTYTQVYIYTCIHTHRYTMDYRITPVHLSEMLNLKKHNLSKVLCLRLLHNQTIKITYFRSQIVNFYVAIFSAPMMVFRCTCTLKYNHEYLCINLSSDLAHGKKTM